MQTILESPPQTSSVHRFPLGIGYCELSVETRIRPWQLSLRLHSWLSPADPPRSADLIFVLAGRMHRKEYALELFRQGLAPRILLSVGRFEIRRFSKMPLPVPLDLLKLAQDLPPAERHYFVAFEGHETQVQHVPPLRFGTLTEIDSLARWLAANPELRSILIVSSGTHLRRIRMCCRSLFNSGLELAFLAAPYLPSEPEERTPLASAADDLIELFKLSIYWVLLNARSKRFS